jgi:thiol-disulfide isomerase/thioredoxin
MYMPLRKSGHKKKKRVGRKTAKTIGTNKLRLVIGKVYANWCGHCQSLKPEWHQMETDIQQMPNMRHVVFVKIEESEKHKLNRFKSGHPGLEVSGYPTIFSHNGQRFNYYRGNRDAASLKQWVIQGGQ